MAFSRKVVGPNWYVHFSQIPALPEQCQTLLESAKRAASSHDLSVYNVLKFHESNQRLTFLSYPDFFEEAFPVLHSFLLVDMSAQVVRYRDLKDSPNPPLLHRKELMLDSNHPKAEEFSALTSLAEEIGLFNEPSRIGLKLSWDRLINSVQGNGSRSRTPGMNRGAPNDQSGQLQRQIRLDGMLPAVH